MRLKQQTPEQTHTYLCWFVSFATNLSRVGQRRHRRIFLRFSGGVFGGTDQISEGGCDILHSVDKQDLDTHTNTVTSQHNIDTGRKKRGKHVSVKGRSAKHKLTTERKMTHRYSGMVILHYINGLVQDCGISIANALEILQSCNKPLIYRWPSARLQ